jgi:uncharacterized repeat protein (TIGR03803 family)
LAAQFTTLFSFNGLDGGNPLAGLTADANGDLFGTTENGGANGGGTVFEIKNIGTVATPIYASAPTTLFSFYASYNGPYGAPEAGLTIDANGNLFGSTTGGPGPTGYGTVFEIKNTGTVAAPAYASAPTTLINFNGIDGFDPTTALIVKAIC